MGVNNINNEIRLYAINDINMNLRMFLL